MPKYLRILLFLALLAAVSVAYAAPKTQEAVIVRSSGSRADMRAKVVALGGKVVHEFSNINALAASLPTGAMETLQALPEFKVWRDAEVAPPSPRSPRGNTAFVQLESTDTLELDRPAVKAVLEKLPADYNLNNAFIGADSLHTAGNLGDNVVVAVIDSGTSQSATALSGSVIGGESFVPGEGEPSATSRLNGSHGTWVGTMIAGHAVFAFGDTTCFARSVARHLPSSAFPGPTFGFPANTVAIPMFGVAPGAKLYAMKVFAAVGGAAPSSRIIEAMDRVITLKRNFRSGIRSVPVAGNGSEATPSIFNSLNIKVVNLSLGGATLNAARELEDELIEQMLKLDIVVAVSSGNQGPSGLTTGSPSTSLASISTGASSIPQHERVFWDVAALEDFPNCNAGALVRPNNTIQTAIFSSRGATADGRTGIDVISAGDWNFVEGADGALSFVGGTSFSAPTVSGAAALLRKARPSASAGKVRNALVNGANFNLLSDHSTGFDQGRGYLNIPASLDLLLKNKVDSSYPRHRANASVKQNLAELGIATRRIPDGSALSFSATHLLPGQRKELIVEIPKSVASVKVDVTSVTPQLPPGQQNQLFGDDIILAVRHAKTSAFSECGFGKPTPDYPVCHFITGPRSFSINDPEPGFMRITVLGDWTNAGNISAALSISATTRTAAPDFNFDGLVGEGEKISIPFNVPANTAKATFELTWLRDWSFYPTNDLDLVLVAPDGIENFDGATLQGRERAEIKNPKAGTWKIEVHGFTVFGVLSHEDGGGDAPKFLRKDLFEVQVHLD